MSDDEEDVKRVVRSEKEKRFVVQDRSILLNCCWFCRHEEMEEIIKKTKHAMRIRDIGLVYECENEFSEFECRFLSNGFFF